MVILPFTINVAHYPVVVREGKVSVHKIGLTIFVSSSGEDFNPCVGDEKRLFKLSRKFPILSYCSPVVGPSFISPCSFRYHWLNCKAMSRLHNSDGFIFCGVKNPEKNVIIKALSGLYDCITDVVHVLA